MRNFGILFSVVLVSAIAWTVAIVLLVASADSVEAYMAWDAIYVVAVAIFAVGVLAHFLVGWSYVRLSRDRSLVAAGVAGLCLAMLLSAIIFVFPTENYNQLEQPPTRVLAATRQWSSFAAALALSVLLAVFGGWVAGRRMSGNERSETADSSLRSE